MRISLDWLRDYVELHESPRELADTLTMLGLGVDAVVPVARTDGVVVARVLERAPHPAAERLTLVTVEAGGERAQVVCGAPNVPAPGALVVWARPGAQLPAAMEGRPIGKRAVKGVESVGMLCSEAELGVADDADGILVLDGDPGLGRAWPRPGEPLGLDDVVLELDITPNRPDALGYIGVARELAAYYDRPLRIPEPVEPQAEPGSERAPGPPVEIADAEACPRYIGRVLVNAQVRRSPLWMRRRLQAVGVRPISNVVDVTNYVLMECSHPLHAFDLARLEGGRIVVRRARPGERMKTLDGVERALTTDDLVIADASRPVALAGVMGGADSEVTQDTREVLLEAAYFAPGGIRRTAKRFGLHTEASHRFERGVDPNGVGWAARRAAQLFGELCGMRGRGAVTDAYPRPIAPLRVALRVSRIRDLVGVAVSAEEAVRRLEPLGFAAREKDGVLDVEVPTRRPDVTLEEDLIEEVARARGGYADIPAELPAAALAAGTLADPVVERTRDALCGQGILEAVTYSFISARDLSALGFGDGDRRARPVGLVNPLREEQSVMRTTLVPGLLASARRNFSRGERRVRLFEIGRVFLERPAGDSAPAVGAGAGEKAEGRLPEERRHVAFVLSGSAGGWLQPGPAVDFFDAKGVVEDLLEALHLPSGPAVVPRSGEATVRFEGPGEPYHHPGQSARILLDGQPVGSVGAVHPEVLDRLGIDEPLVCAELDLDALRPRALQTPLMAELPRYPGTSRDLSFFVDEAFPSARVVDILGAAGEALLQGVAPREDYREPGKVPPGKKGLLYTLTYRAKDRTLTDEEVNRAHEALVARLLGELAPHGVERR